MWVELLSTGERLRMHNRDKENSAQQLKNKTKNTHFLLPAWFSGRLRGGRWRSRTGEMWRTPSVTCWGDCAPPAPMWVLPSSKSWAGEPPSSVSHNSRATCLFSGVYACTHHTHRLHNHTHHTCVMQSLNVQWWDMGVTNPPPTHTHTRSPNLFLSGYLLSENCCFPAGCDLKATQSLTWNILPEALQRSSRLNPTASVFTCYTDMIIGSWFNFWTGNVRMPCSSCKAVWINHSQFWEMGVREQNYWGMCT